MILCPRNRNHERFKQFRNERRIYIQEEYVDCYEDNLEYGDDELIETIDSELDGNIVCCECGEVALYVEDEDEFERFYQNSRRLDSDIIEGYGRILDVDINKGVRIGTKEGDIKIGVINKM